MAKKLGKRPGATNGYKFARGTKVKVKRTGKTGIIKKIIPERGGWWYEIDTDFVFYAEDELTEL